MTSNQKRQRRTLTRDQYFVATRSLKISDEIKIAAYYYMVEGMTFAEIAKLTGVNDRSVQRKVRVIWTSYASIVNDRKLPDGWVEDTIMLPKEEMEKVKELERVLLESMGKIRILHVEN